MGYYSTFEVTYGGGANLSDEMYDELRNIAVDYEEEEEEFLKEVCMGQVETKWYSCYEDIKRLSLKFPNDTFSVRVIGEDNQGDGWDIKNGQELANYQLGWVKVEEEIKI